LLAKSVQFPCIFPLNRDFCRETSSPQTGPTTNKSAIARISGRQKCSRYFRDLAGSIPQHLAERWQKRGGRYRYFRRSVSEGNFRSQVSGNALLRGKGHCSRNAAAFRAGCLNGYLVRSYRPDLPIGRSAPRRFVWAPQFRLIVGSATPPAIRRRLKWSL
jgi:hypothetical protein